MLFNFSFNFTTSNNSVQLFLPWPHNTITRERAITILNKGPAIKPSPNKEQCQLDDIIKLSLPIPWICLVFMNSIEESRDLVFALRYSYLHLFAKVLLFTGQVLHGGSEGDCLHAPWSLPWYPWKAPVEI